MNLAISDVLFAIFIALKLIVNLSFFSRYFGCDFCRKILFCGVSQ